MKHKYPMNRCKRPARIMVTMTMPAIILTLAAMCMAITGCRNPYTPADDIATAEQALNIQDYELARSICETFTTDSTTGLTVTDLCRLSIIYMKLSDVENTEINTATATQCYRNAMKADSDSATLYYNSLSIDEARHVEIMSQIDRILNGSSNYYIDQDSVTMDYYNDCDNNPMQ